MIDSRRWRISFDKFNQNSFCEFIMSNLFILNLSVHLLILFTATVAETSN